MVPVAPNLSEMLSQRELIVSLRASGMSMAEACLRAGVPRATAYRRLSDQPTKERQIGGRPRKFQLTAEESAAFTLFYMKKRSLDLAVEELIEAPVCRAETKEMLMEIKAKALARRRPVQYPPSLRQAAYAGDEIQAAFRGKRAASKFGLKVQRTMEYIDIEGVTWQLLANDLYESDDVSINEDYTFFDQDQDRIAHACQVLVTVDVPTGSYRLCQAVGRTGDSYTAVDIMDHKLMVVRHFGLPRKWRLERGRWKNKAIDGVLLDDLANRYGWAERFRGVKWGGLSDLYAIERCFSSNGKGYIEGSFDQFQNLLAHPDEGVTRGRVRGEFEEAAKLLRQANRGDMKALAKFWTMAEATAGMIKASERYNSRPHQRLCYGKKMVIPTELDEEMCQPKRELPESEVYRFCPIKKLARVKGGAITVTVPGYNHGYAYQFLVNGNGEWGGYCNEGHEVLIAFHPDRASDGCEVFNADMGNRNRAGWTFGQRLCTAPHTQSRVPQWDDRPAGERDHTGKARRQAGKASRSEYAIIKAAGKSERVSATANGNGATLRVGKALVMPKKLEGVSEERIAAISQEVDVGELLAGLADF
jgi:hypothetical protein